MKNKCTFLKLLRFELFNRKKLICTALLLYVAVCLTFIYSMYLFVDKSSSEPKSLYLVPAYSSQEELKTYLDTSVLTLDEMEREYNLAVEAEANEYLLSTKSNAISEQRKQLNVMRLLYDNAIPYEDAVAYSSFDKDNGAGAVSYIISLFALVLEVVAVIAVSRAIPSEIKEGQIRLTAISPMGRTSYAFSKWAVVFIKKAFVLLIFSAFCFGIVAALYPTGGKYVVYATENSAFTLTFLESGLLQVAFSLFSAFVLSITAFSISLFIKSPLFSTIVSLFVCFAEIFLQSLLMDPMRARVVKWIPFFNFRLEAPFLFSLANDMLYTALIGGAFALVLLTTALLAFRKSDLE